MAGLRDGWRAFLDGIDWTHLREYWGAVWGHAWEIWWGAGVLGVVCTGLTLYYVPSRWLLGWVVAWAVLIAGYYTWRPYHVRLTPKGRATKARLQHSPISRPVFAGFTGLPIRHETLDRRTFVQVEFRCLTEAPLYECKGYLEQIRRWWKDRWEAAEFGSLVLKWDNENESQQITQHPRVEKALNVIAIWHSDRHIELWCFGDMSPVRIAEFFRNDITKYEFDIKITYSDRTGGQHVSIKPESVCLSVEMTADPCSPRYELKSRSKTDNNPRSS